jgi:hypothetical protein
MLSLAGLCAYLPSAILGPFAGVWVDRLNRKTVMITADLFTGLIALIFAGVFFWGSSPYWAACLVLGIRAIGSVFHSPALQAAIPLLVPQAELVKANSVNQFIYESNGYWDFWEKQDKIPGQDCDSICGLLDSIKGKLDGKDDAIGKYSGQIMAHIYEADGKFAEAYGVRLPTAYNGPVPENMLLIDIPEKEYIVFEHGPFNYDEESDTVGEKLQTAIDSFDFSKSDYKPDNAAGRISYFYFVPESFEKRIQPVTKK